MKTSPLLHIVRLARRLNATADAAEKKKSPFVEAVNDLKFLFEMGYKLVLLAGVLPTVGYLIVSVHFYPAGLTIGDSFFFLMVGFAFGLVYLFLLLYFAVVATSLESLFRGAADWQRWSKRIGVVVGYVALLIAPFILTDKESAAAFVGALAGFTVSGITVVILKHRLMAPVLTTASTPPSPTTSAASPLKSPILSDAQQKGLNVFLACLVLFSPVIVGSVFLQRMNENIAMKSVGLRSMDVTVKLSEENYNILSSAASGQYLAALGCNTSPGTPERLVHGVNLLWHGIGERSLVELRSDQEPRLVVELKREGIFFFRNYKGMIERCLEMSGDALFKPGSSVLAADDGADLSDTLKVIEENKDKIKEIQVIGHADAFGYKGGAELNNKLALNRAKEIKDHIVEFAHFSEVTAVGHGSREPKTLCKDWPVKETISECLAINRRVEVRMKFWSEKELQDIKAKSDSAAKSRVSKTLTATAGAKQ